MNKIDNENYDEPISKSEWWTIIYIGLFYLAAVFAIIFSGY